MSKILIQCLCFVVWFVKLDCQSYQDRPKIITSNGNIILEPALNKNIYIRPNGPRSAVFAKDVNLLDISSNSEPQQVTDRNVDRYISGLSDIQYRLDKLEKQNSGLLPSFALNETNLVRRVNRLHSRVLSLQNQIRRITRDECQENPCQKGGTCLNLANGYHCLCPSNWEGQDCDIDVNECRNFAGTDLGCQNGATCINKPGTYECLCSPGWYGMHCTRRENDCSQGNFEMCGYGTCVTTNAGKGFQCICNQGWETNGTGVACLTDVNECDTSRGPRCSVNPKVDCINLPGSFRCGQCPAGYEGDGFTCSDINECLTMPNGGCSPLVACHNTIGSRICGSCPPGYQGDGLTCTFRGTCNINNGGCHPSAQCVENMALVQCVCPYGMDGDGVGIHGCYVATYGNSSQRCENNPCGVHGQCHPLLTGYTCLCYKGYSGAHCETASDVCSHNPCQNGGTCRSEESSTGFRCECTAQYTGNLCQIKKRTCGGFLEAEEGSIVYPLTNTSYNQNERCAWVIHTMPSKVINVTFSKFHLEKEPECMYDFLQIHDGRTSSSHLIGRFCGTEFPMGGNIISSHNYLYFWFRSDSTITGPGFSLHWNSIDPVCGGEVNASTHGVISSPGSPGKYPPNRDCYWHLSTAYGKRISLHFFTLDIESHPNCSFDYVAIYDGEHITDPLINKYCNSTQPQPIQSASSELMIHFHSDPYGAGTGFQISYASVEGIPGCGGYFTLDKGEIVSPSFGGEYMHNLRCEYKISTGPDTKIRIDFKSFSLEQSRRCKFDYLKIYDGPSSESKLVGKFCGKTYPKTFVSSSNNLFFVFRSDYNIASEGFKITFESLCRVTLFGDSGVIKSPGYPFSYPSNKVCEYIIGTVPGKAIQLTFQDFDIEDNNYYNCRYDHIEIRDGADINSTLLGTYCGGSEHIPPVQVSTHNYLYIQFKSDMSISGTGFYANYTTIDTECGGIYKETTGLITHPPAGKLTYDNHQTCTWMLVAPEGKHIHLTWNRFDLETTRSSCSLSDYLELFEIDTQNCNESLGKYCGTTAPPSLTVTSNRLLMKFKSDDSVRTTGFSVLYTFLDESTHCSGTYVKSHGYIYSPGWPKNYEPNKDCKWVIKAPVGQQIMLNITNFNIERPIRNKCDFGDYLEIRNGQSSTSPLVGKYCGKFNSKLIKSMANSLFLHFHSDFYLTGSGFKIEWTSTATGCGGTLTSSSGSISSPNYPENYNDNAECFYRIVTSQGSRVSITFTDLDLERTASCRDDYVEIFDGRDQSSPSLGRHCTMSSKLVSIQTTSNAAFIKFRSDYYNTGKGFLLNYETVCQNNITEIYGIIESPDYPNNYPLGLNCLWTINVPQGNKINVSFTHFDVYNRPYSHWRWSSGPTEKCDNDYLQIKESNEIEFSKRYCGTRSPNLHTTNTNSLQLKFVSGTYYPTTGFRLEWAKYGCGGRMVKSFGAIDLLKSDTSEGPLECQWVIESRLGTRISIDFTDIYMSESINCTVDAIEIFNGPNINSPLVSKFCHRIDSIHTFQSSSNFMFIKFTKNSYLKDVHFNSSFHSSTSSCGGRIRSHSGMIYSPNYPNNYDNDIDCLWTITVPKNHRIELNFMFFDLFSIDSSCGDNIKVYDTISIAQSNYSQIICPDSHVTQLVSKSNNLALQFITDHYGGAKGFKANFTVTCGATITATYDGVITNDKYISNSNRSCFWTIIAPRLDQKITLTITHMSLPKKYDTSANRTCPSSYLRIFDGIDENSPMFNEYCGSYTPTIVSHGNALTLELGTYNNVIEGHFSAHYTALDNACGGTLTSEEGAIASPNYPNPYPPNTDCEWILGTSPGNRVYLIFEAFDLDISEDCTQDYVEVRENNGGGPLLGAYCGSDIPTNTTKGTKLYIKFRSDTIGSKRGFLLKYGFLHGNNIVGNESGEIASPLYPYQYTGTGEYTWRVTVPRDTISITITHLEIHTQGTECSSNLAVYDGYDEEAPLLDRLCGILSNEEKSTKTTSNVVFIKLTLDDSNTGSLFLVHWSKSNSDELETSKDNEINCGFNDIQLVLPGQPKTIQSPRYPESYNDNLNCEWKYKTVPGRHVDLRFSKFLLEERENCYADFVSIYSSNAMSQWQPVKENICLKEDTTIGFNSSTFMKVKFVTDGSVTNKGFIGTVTSLCGGLLTDSSNLIRPSWFDWLYTQQSSSFSLRCKWTVKVRPGRVIRLKFLHFNITNADSCMTNVILHNGESSESPILGSGKYCGYDHEDRTTFFTTTSNALYVTYKTNAGQRQFKTFSLWYEEVNIQCGATSTLSSDHSWEILNSPNYPSVSTPYIECEWVFTGPPGEVLRIDFVERFDIDSKSSECLTEFVEVRDGSSVLSPLKGRFCSEKPGTIKTSSNLMYVKYSTQISEPRNGFKANVSIDVCGGTMYANAGELTSAGYPHMAALPYGTVCVWEIIGSSENILKLKAQDINLPEPESRCGTKITIEETLPENNTVTLLRTYCSDDIFDSTNAITDTLTNRVTLKLHIGKSSTYSQVSTLRGFRFTFNSSMPKCGGVITTPDGFLATPGYPRDITLRYCSWQISVPDKTRRVTLELLDFDRNAQRIGMYNDRIYASVIQTIPSEDYTSSSYIFESSGPTMVMYVWLVPSKGSHHRFKAKFNSDNLALCGGSLSGESGHIDTPNLDRSFNCLWQYQPDSTTENDTITRKISKTTTVIKIALNSSSTTFSCRRYDPQLVILSKKSNKGYVFNRNLCRSADVVYRVPTSALEFRATKSNSGSLYFSLDWQTQQCGGIIEISENPVNILNVPVNLNDSIDCAWIILVPSGNRAEISLQGAFQFECKDEFITINQNTEETSLTIGDYCKDKNQDTPLLASFRALYIQYHSKPSNDTKVKLMAKLMQNPCGDHIMTHASQFSSPNYPKSYIENQECTWEIKTDLGSRVSLQFTGRFAIEGQPGSCTKDAVIIYDWKNNAYSEVARLCGRNPPPPINSTFNQMKVVLRTNENINLDGFQANWTPICGGSYIATEQEQFLYSPGYPYHYWGSLNCVYKISSLNRKVIVKFIEFELEGPFPECNNDNVTISANDPYDYMDSIYCGTNTPPLSFADSVNIKFQTDWYLSRKGFKISYWVVPCGGEINSTTTISSGPTHRYDTNLNCTWKVTAPRDKIIVVDFMAFDLENNDECYNDYMAIYDGSERNEDKRLALLCGHFENNSSLIIKSTNNTMRLEFVTDSSVSGKGFKAAIYFTYSESVGCGGHIDLSSSTEVRSPLIDNHPVYENFLDCIWTIVAPIDHIIKVHFTSFHIAPCEDVNQTAIGLNNCDCDYVDIRDGISVNSAVVNKYCGNELPPDIVSSTNSMSLRLHTDGEIPSKGFEATLSVLPSVCGQSTYNITDKATVIRSPGYESGVVPRGLRCVYHIKSYVENYRTVLLRIKSLDLQPGSVTADQCNRDKLIISEIKSSRNISLGKDYILNSDSAFYFDNAYLFEQSDALVLPTTQTYCGKRKFAEFYFIGHATITLQTSPESDSTDYKGFEIEFLYSSYCGSNYTQPYGRVGSVDDYNYDLSREDCYTLITAPENHTVSAYFLRLSPTNWHEDMYLEVHDGNKTSAKSLKKIDVNYNDILAVFSTGRYMLLHNHVYANGFISYDLTYVTTDRGPGCGGKLHSEVGRITSPFYPDIYRQRATCEWELETPPNTRLHLRFSAFMLSAVCDQVYLQLVDRKGKLISTFCTEAPADYTSEDNYVKVVFVTTMNNGGTGWVAEFIGLSPSSP